MKICRICKLSLSEEKFGKWTGSPGGLSSSCKSCEINRNKLYRERNKELVREKGRARHLSRHGLTVESFKSLENDQNGVCKICKKKKKLTIDHDHKCCASTFSCGKCVRGLLCDHCNRAISLLDENLETMYNAIEYLS